jgi:hypothetical protein
VAISTKTITDFLGETDAKKLTEGDVKKIDAILKDRLAIDPDRTGELSGNTKRINAVIGPRTGRTIVFTKTASKTAQRPATQAALKELQTERDNTPRWEPGKKASLTRQIKAMEKALAAKASS